MILRTLAACLALLFSVASLGAADTAPAALVVANRSVMVFRAPFLGVPPSIRATRARAVIDEGLRQGGPLAVSVKPHLEELLVMLDDHLAFVVTAGDLDPAREGRPEDLARQAAASLQQVVAETREARNLEYLLKALGASAAATLVFLLLLRGLVALREWLARVLLAKAERRAGNLRLAGIQLLDGQSLVPFLRGALEVLRWLAILLLTYEWAGFLLSRFPYTRPWGEHLNGYLVGVGGTLLAGIAGALPGLGFALVIFLLARVLVGFVGRLFLRLSQAEAPPHWLAPETMPTTRRLVSVLIWLFALAIAYPYLPGSQSEAFKGLSVLLGLMISLGSSSLVGQGAAGLILTYTRTLRPGEYVRIGENEGTVMETGIFTTRIQTGLGEELTLPNSLITAGVTRNYSRIVQGRGYILDTTVTIGYDTPWRQVEAMLVEAARRTPGILPSPEPQVFQTALSDYYPEYRLVAQAIPSRPRPRAEVLNDLHANIQDVFNEYGVQIMSPHYLGDPAQAKVVPPADWYPAPARREGIPS
jgi:small-conductance mechanosensitive channel